jgi:ribulose kinase
LGYGRARRHRRPDALLLPKRTWCALPWEAICYQTREVLDAMQADAGIELRTLKVDGGAVVNNLLDAMQADI